jgi:hypothetical protein
MPQASIFAFARSCDLDLDGDLLRHSDAATTGNRTTLPSAHAMP